MWILQLLVCKYSTSELANIAVNSDGTHSVCTPLPALSHVQRRTLKRFPSAPTDPGHCASVEPLFCRLQVVDTFQIQDVDGEIVQPIKSSCYAYGGTCKVQAL